MSELRGRPYVFVAVTILCWVGARMAWPDTQIAGEKPSASKPALAQNGHAASASIAPQFWPRLVRFAPASLHDWSAPRAKHAPVIQFIGLPPVLVPGQVGGRPSGLSMPLRVAGDDKPVSAGWDTPPTIAHTPVGKAGTPEFLRPKRWEVYGYSFWRLANSRAPPLAPAAQYGGSQSGIIATYDPWGQPDTGLALLARGAVTPDGDQDEAAFGARWKPKGLGPIQLSGEYRLRSNEPDQFAAYLSGGVNEVSLVSGWRLDAFGQAGYASGKSGSGFFDANARISHLVTKQGRVSLSAGAGGWAGGQKGAQRLDIGPTIAAKIDTGPAIILIQLDWRLRVAGDAQPENGFALTVSSGF